MLPLQQHVFGLFSQRIGYFGSFWLNGDACGVQKATTDLPDHQQRLTHKLKELSNVCFEHVCAYHTTVKTSSKTPEMICGKTSLQQVGIAINIPMPYPCTYSTVTKGHCQSQTTISAQPRSCSSTAFPALARIPTCLHKCHSQTIRC